MVNRSDAEKEAVDLFGINKKEFVLMTKFTPVPFAEELMKKFTFMYDKHSRLWMYDEEEGIWKMNIENKLKSILRKNLMGDEQQKKNYIEEIIAYIKDTSFNEEFETNKYDFLIPLKNKVYNLKENTFLDFKPEFYLTNKINIELNAAQECPVIDKFFEDCVGKEYKEMLYDLCAYCLYKKYPYQKLFFIYGPAGTGKSQFMNFLEIFLGDDNVCSLEPQHIEKDQFASQQMVGKLANISSDIKYDALEDITQVKKMTGGDTIRVREMYKNPYNTKLYCKHIFSTNKLPVVKEKTRAWYRRVYLIPFENIISSENMDRNILSKITTQKELQGFLYICLKRLRELYEHDFVFTYDIDDREMQFMYEQLSNPILMFINENCDVGANHFCFKWEFNERLNNWLKTQHFIPYTKSQINQYMKEYYSESNRQSGIGDKIYRVWVGLSWKSSHNPSSFNQFNRFNGVKQKVYIYRRSFQTPLNPLNPLNGKNDENDK